MFVDQVKVSSQAGSGGRGCVSFRREKFVPKGGPDGGDGGRGGDVVLRADRHVDNLTNFFYEPIIKAKSGGHGQGKKMHGRSAPVKVVKVPVGTIVYELRNADGGLRVEESEREEGEQGHFLFELRTIADAGLVGYPNAGKSTLLRIISAARPKVAPYPFTTLHPIIGVVEFPGYGRATIADIPGLIEGAHRGLGLGDEFLRHITRCQILLFVIDVAGSERRDPTEDLRSLRREIDLYDPALSKRPWYVVANKMDLPAARKNLEALQHRFPTIGTAAVSAQTGEGMEDLKAKLEKWLARIPQSKAADPTKTDPISFDN